MAALKSPQFTYELRVLGGIYISDIWVPKCLQKCRGRHFAKLKGSFTLAKFNNKYVDKNARGMPQAFWQLTLSKTATVTATGIFVNVFIAKLCKCK
jgi:hypothetical protein